MVITLLFLATICIFFFFPVDFRIYYKKVAWDDLFIYEMTFLNGLIKRRRVISLIKPTPKGFIKKKKNSGKWFFLKKARVKTEIVPQRLDSRGLREFLQKNRHFGLGITLLNYLLPAKYQRWLLVVEDLEKKGRFHKFVWKTCIGTGEASGTSLIYGILWAIKGSLLNYLQNKIRFDEKPLIQITPDYQKCRWDTIFDCIFRIKLGYIIIASLIARFRLRLLKGGVF